MINLIDCLVYVYRNKLFDSYTQWPTINDIIIHKLQLIIEDDSVYKFVEGSMYE